MTCVELGCVSIRRVLCAVRSVSCLAFCFFFQAEDGIRDLVRSRGLGDVYKRQPLVGNEAHARRGCAFFGGFGEHLAEIARCDRLAPVSYTHLTLPTSDLV